MNPKSSGTMTTIFGGVLAFVIPKLKEKIIPRSMKYIFPAAKKHFKYKEYMKKNTHSQIKIE